jgi:hypothetical protein
LLGVACQQLEGDGQRLRANKRQRVVQEGLRDDNNFPCQLVSFITMLDVNSPQGLATW